VRLHAVHQHGTDQITGIDHAGIAQAVIHALGILAGHHDMLIAQQAQVLAHRGDACLDLGGDIRNTPLAAVQGLNDRQPGGIRHHAA
jgi:hypothetical protein